MESLAFLNGRYLPLSQAAVPLTDSGFVQGTTIAEQLRTFGGRLFRLSEHLARLRHALNVLRLDPGMSDAQLAAVAEELVARDFPLLNPADDLGLSIFVTPGDYASYSKPGPVQPRVGLHTYPLPFVLWASQYEAGQALRTTSIRQVPRDCWPPDVKCRSRMHYYLADREAAEAEPGARAVLLDAEGYVTEASTANVLIYRAAEGLILPPRETVLHGVSQNMLCELAQRLGLAVSYRRLRPDDLASADEVLLSSTPFGALPVTRFNGKPVSDGRPGPAYRRLLAAWSEAVGLDFVLQARRFASRQ